MNRKNPEESCANERILIRKPELQSKELKALDLVQSLAEYLNNEDGVIRAKGLDGYPNDWYMC